MTIERWANTDLGEDDSPTDECGACGITLSHLVEPCCEGCHERVHVLEPRDIRTIRRAADAFEAIAMTNRPGVADLTVFAKGLRSILPSDPEPPPTADEWAKLVEQTLDDEITSSEFDRRASDLLCRHSNARKDA